MAVTRFRVRIGVLAALVLSTMPGSTARAPQVGCAPEAFSAAAINRAVRFAWQEPLEGGGRRIILITDRHVSIWDESMRLRSTPEAFTVIELRIPDEADGEGKVAIGSNVHVNRSLDLIELEDYASAALRLVGVRTSYTTTM